MTKEAAEIPGGWNGKGIEYRAPDGALVWKADGRETVGFLCV